MLQEIVFSDSVIVQHDGKAKPTAEYAQSILAPSRELSDA